MCALGKGSRHAIGYKLEGILLEGRESSHGTPGLSLMKQGREPAIERESTCLGCLLMSYAIHLPLGCPLSPLLLSSSLPLPLLLVGIQASHEVSYFSLLSHSPDPCCGF